MIEKRVSIATFSSGIKKNQSLKKFLNYSKLYYKPTNSLNSQIGIVVGWGMKANTQVAFEYAKAHGIPYLRLEDGFIHSLGQGVLGDQSCSLVQDTQGIYYNSRQSSDLESHILESDQNFTYEDSSRSKRAIARIVAANITKYNNASEDISSCNLQEGNNILVIDQTAGDMSAVYGEATSDTFRLMLEAALQENPDASILVKTHPDVIARKKKGWLSLSKDPRVCLISTSINPLVLLKQVDHVYTATSQMGFEALLVGKPVSVFGVPFYSGWGLTDDRADPNLEVFKRRSHSRTLEQLFSSAYIDYSTYIHPVSRDICQLEDIITYFESQGASETSSLKESIIHRLWRKFIDMH